MKVAVAYTVPPPRGATDTPDTMADAAVMDQVTAVEEALARLGHDFSRLPLDSSDPAGFVRSLLENRPDVVVNLIESLGTNNRGQSYTPALFELLGIAYTGAGPAALAVCTDKWLTKGALIQAGIPVPAGALVAPGGGLPQGLRFPLFIKPAYEDASIGIDITAVCTNGARAAARLAVVHAQYGWALVEEYIDGREINAAVTPENGGTVYPLYEIDLQDLPPGHPKVFTFAAKWFEGSPEYEGTDGLCPAPLEPAVAGRIADYALKAFRALHVRGYARVDFRLAADGGVYVLEVNANPDITPTGGMLRSWGATGRDFDSFIAYLLQEAREGPKI